jgi:hypothetical protein
MSAHRHTLESKSTSFLRLQHQRPYPRYIGYKDIKKLPSQLSQKFPRPAFQTGENYYPPNKRLERYFSSEEESHKFGAACFSGFLDDTVEVEQWIVIPAISSLRRLPYEVPAQVEQDLFKTITDEGFHAEQALQFSSDLRDHFGLAPAGEFRTSLFIRRLEGQRSDEPNPLYQHLITVLNGVVTETRISVELSKFAADKFLAQSVREVCRTHADDEAVHASQFKALGEWLWEAFDEQTRHAAAGFYNASTIARSLPDVERLAFFLHQATGRRHAECRKHVYEHYTEDVVLEEMQFAAKPTVAFLHKLGVDQYAPFEVALERERERLRFEMAARRQWM